MKTLTFTQALAGYRLYAEAKRLSPHTLADYENTFNKFLEFLEDDPPVDQIDHHQVEEFLAAQPVKSKTLLNYHTGLSALWTWLRKEELAPVQILHQVDRPEPEKPAIVPYSEADLRAMLAALGHSRRYTRPGMKESAHSLPNPERNRALILLLLDTGARASELANALIAHLDVRNKSLRVFGKGKKERPLPFSPRTAQALWKYLATRSDDTARDPLFLTDHGNPMSRDRLLKTIMAIGKRAGVQKPVNVHRFRHTFAINFLRNGGDPWSLQTMLGHTTMEMVRTYLAIAQADLDINHRRASPVEKFRL